MYADNTLTPKEAVRLCALGTLALSKQPMRYSVLAHDARHFMSRVTGPSLELMGTSLELLKFEGLIAPSEGQGMEDDALMDLTDKGHQELIRLLTARVRADSSDLNKLIITLKFRFLHLLDDVEQCNQVDSLCDAAQAELARLGDLRDNHCEEEGQLTDWLDHDLDLIEKRLDWLEALRNKLYAKAYPED
jgi:DNA-binding PadR family transcriptional regulator